MTEPTSAERPLLPTLRRFLPYLWPKESPALRLRIVGAMSLVVLSKLVQVYGAPFALQGAVDGMAKGDRSATTLILALVIGYAAARFGSVLFDNLRNAVFEKVGQDATRRLAATVVEQRRQAVEADDGDEDFGSTAGSSEPRTPPPQALAVGRDAGHPLEGQ